MHDTSFDRIEHLLHPVDNRQKNNRITAWLYASRTMEDAIAICEQALIQNKDKAAVNAPDVLMAIVKYGHSRLVVRKWDELPIAVPPELQHDWREVGYAVDMFGYLDRAAQIAGGLLHAFGASPSIYASLIMLQLNNRLELLDELLRRPLEHYTPKDFTEADLIDEADDDEARDFDQPFVIREELEGFMYGFERLRMLAISEDNVKLGLPNRELYDALLSIDLNALHRHVAEADVTLRKILQRLASHNYFELDSTYIETPEVYWWRHWREQQGSRGPKRTG